MKKRGFTLIELLVVIAIIGILASIVLVSLATARTKAKTAGIEAEMSQLRIAAEMAYMDSAAGYDAICVEAGGGVGESTLSGTGDIGRLKTSIESKAAGLTQATVVCNEAGTATNSTAYAAWVSIPSPVNNWHCVDSTGAARRLTVVPAAGVTACP